MGTRIVLTSNVYCGGEWSNKLQLSNHRSKGCLDVPIDPRTNKPICIPVLPNLTIAQLSKVLKRQIENNDASSIQLKLRPKLMLMQKQHWRKL